MKRNLEILKGFAFALYIGISFLFSNIIVYLLRYLILYIKYTRKFIPRPEFNIVKGLFEFRFEKPFIYIYLLALIFIVYSFFKFKRRFKALAIKEKGRSRFTS